MADDIMSWVDSLPAPDYSSAVPDQSYIDAAGFGNSFGTGGSYPSYLDLLSYDSASPGLSTNYLSPDFSSLYGQTSLPFYSGLENSIYLYPVSAQQQGLDLVSSFLKGDQGVGTSSYDQIPAVSAPESFDASAYADKVGVPIQLPDGSTVYRDANGNLLSEEEWMNTRGSDRGLGRLMYNGSGIQATQNFSGISDILRDYNKAAGYAYDPANRYYIDKQLAGRVEPGADNLIRYTSDTKLNPGQEGYLQETLMPGTRDAPNMTDILASTPEGRRMLMNSGAIDKDVFNQYVAAINGDMGLGVDGYNNRESLGDRIRGSLASASSVGKSALGSPSQVAARTNQVAQQNKTKTQTALGTLAMLAQMAGAMQKTNRTPVDKGAGAQGMKWARFANGGAVVDRMAGGGQEDNVHAKLSGGEYVMDADVVSALGDGSTEAGAAKLDQMREAIRSHKRSAKNSEIPPKAKSPLQYMKGAK